MCFADGGQAGIDFNDAFGHGINHGVELFDGLGHFDGHTKKHAHGDQQASAERTQHDARVQHIATVVFLNLRNHFAHGRADISSDRCGARGHLGRVKHHRCEFFNLTCNFVAVERLIGNFGQASSRLVHQLLLGVDCVFNRLFRVCHV